MTPDGATLTIEPGTVIRGLPDAATPGSGRSRGRRLSCRASARRARTVSWSMVSIDSGESIVGIYNLLTAFQ